MDEWQFPKNTKGLAGFVRDLGRELEAELVSKMHDVVIRLSMPYSIRWCYKPAEPTTHSGRIIITKSKQKGGNTLNIKRGWGIITRVSPGHSTCASQPKELRDAAQIYDDVDAFLERKYGKPTERNLDYIYKAHLK